MTAPPVAWKRRLTFSLLGTTAGFPVGFIQQLDGLEVRCEECGAVSAFLRRRRFGFSSHTYYTHCPRCHSEHRVGGEFSATVLVDAVAPDLVGRVFPSTSSRDR